MGRPDVVVAVPDLRLEPWGRLPDIVTEPANAGDGRCVLVARRSVRRSVGDAK